MKFYCISSEMSLFSKMLSAFLLVVSVTQMTQGMNIIESSASETFLQALADGPNDATVRSVLSGPVPNIVEMTLTEGFLSAPRSMTWHMAQQWQSAKNSLLATLSTGFGSALGVFGNAPVTQVTSAQVNSFVQQLGQALGQFATVIQKEVFSGTVALNSAAMNNALTGFGKVLNDSMMLAKSQQTSAATGTGQSG